MMPKRRRAIALSGDIAPEPPKPPKPPKRAKATPQDRTGAPMYALPFGWDQWNEPNDTTRPPTEQPKGYVRRMNSDKVDAPETTGQHYTSRPKGKRSA